VDDTGGVAGSTLVRVLGGPSVDRDGAACPVGGPKAQQLLCILVAQRGQIVSTDRLEQALWGDRAPPSAIGTMQSQVSRLRALLGPTFPIDRTEGGYRLDHSSGDVDADRFERELNRSTSLDAEAAAAALESALRWWNGPAFAGHAHLEGVRGEAMRLDELRLVATDAWAEARVATGDPSRMIGDLEALVRAHPLREHYWRLLMLALHRAGRQAEALRRSAELRDELRRTTGLDPPPSIRDLEDRILSGDPALLTSVPTAPRSRIRSVGVPRLLGPTSFIGRDPEVSAAVDALHTQALVTVTGPGGVGKTRLAMRVAAAYLDHVEDGVTVVEFAPLRDPGGVAQVIANALDIQQRQYRTVESTIEEHLADADRLLVLDNCEHLTEAIAPLVDGLRSACPELKILTTSREPLGLACEYVAQLAPLDLPPADVLDPDALRRSYAVELFVSRAGVAAPGFTLTADNAVAVASICRRLEGLPLALELAAARLRSMGVEALAARLRERVGLMSQTQRGADGRNRTLHDVVGWSHTLLQPDEQVMFEELAVFAGGFDLPAVDSVCASTISSSTLDTLVNLVDKSMVVFIDPSGPRYRLLEPLREFGRDRLRERHALESTEDRHLAWFRDLAERGGRGMDGPDEGLWSRLLEHEGDNLRAAHATAVRRGDTDSAMRVVASLREHAFRRIRYEIVAWADDTMAMPGAVTHPLAGTVLAVSAYGRFVTGDMEGAIERAL
jgi:predicted ATPase/DNA-binding SARP family transcriptional activator